MGIVPFKSAEVRLFSLGFYTLFFELLLIRYLAGNIWNLGYFPNLVLVGAFVGIGAGFVFHRHISEENSRKVFLFGSGLLLATVLELTFYRPKIPGFGLHMGNLGGDTYFTYTANAVPSEFAVYLLGLVFLAVILFFFAVGQKTAKAFNHFSPLKAYTLDIFGSLTGVAVFMGISALQLPATYWFLMALPGLLGCLNVASRHQQGMGAAILLACSGVVQWQDSNHFLGKPRPDPARAYTEVSWSPYQKVEYYESDKGKMILVNGINHQTLEYLEDMRSNYYAVPYRDRQNSGRAPFKKVLVIGAGSGNDVAYALSTGVERVDAVEIDPVIADIGLRRHPEKPFSDPRVNMIIDDGRAVLTRSREKYDLIVFALTDSLVKASAMSQLRLENYLFTVESLKRAYSLLAPGGAIALYNDYRADWLVTKLSEALEAGTGQTPRIPFNQENIAVLLVNKAEGSVLDTSKPKVNPAIDDWPFIYLKEPGIPLPYRWAIFVVVCVAALFLGVSEAVDRHGQPIWRKAVFFFMGAAFLLLESKSVVQFSLLFGTTWLNSSLVFFAVLTSVLLANWIAAFFPKANIFVIFGLLLVSCLFESYFPFASLLDVPHMGHRYLLASAAMFTPVFLANVLFGLLFRDQKKAEILFGWNIVGATLGAAVEYFSMLAGYSVISLLVAVFYSLVFLLYYQFGRQKKGRA